MRRRVLLVILSAIFMFGMTSVFSFAASSADQTEDSVASVTIGDVTTYYDSFSEAVDAAKGEPVTLLQKISDPYVLASPDSVIKVIKNGKTVTVRSPEGPYVISSSTEDGITTYSAADAIFETTLSSGKVSYYLSLNLAVADGATVKLLDDFTTTSNPNVSSSIQKKGSVTLDLNGHTLYINSKNRNYCLLIGQNRTLTVKNGTIKMAPTSADKSNGILVQDTATLNVEKDAVIEAANGVSAVTLLKGVTLNTEGDLSSDSSFAIAANGSSGNGGYTVNINGGSVTSAEVSAIYHPNEGTVNITGGEITGKTAVYQKAGTLNITGGTLKATGEKKDYEFNGNGANSTGDAVVVDNCGYPGGVPAPQISGGTFISANADAVGSYKNGENDVVSDFIEGGEFNSDVSALLKDGVAFASVTKDSETNYVAGEEAIKEAATEAKAGDAIVVLEGDIAIDETKATVANDGDGNVTVGGEPVKNTETLVPELSKELAAAKDTISELNSEVSNLKSDLQTAQQNAQNLQATIDELNSKLEDAGEEAEGLKAKITELEGELETANNKIDELTGKITDLEGQLETANLKVDELTTQVDTLTGENGELKDSVNELTGQLEEAKNESKELSNQVTSLNGQLEDANSTIEDLSGQVSDLTEELNNANADKEDLQSKLDEANDTIDDLQGEVNDLNDQISDLNDQVSGLNDQLDDANDTISDLNDQIDTLKKEKADAQVVDITNYAVALENDSYEFTGEEIRPSVTVSGLTDEDYTVEYADNTAIGTAKITIKGNTEKNYKGAIEKTFEITKKHNTLTVSPKTATVKVKKLKNNSQKLKVSKVLTVADNQGELSFTKVKGSKKITINKSTGKVKVKRGTKKGSYKVKVDVTAAGDDVYDSLTETVTFKIKVK